MKNKLLPLDFNYLLLEYYKDLGITDDELIVLLMSNHLILDNNLTLTLELLELKINMPFQRIDYAFNSLLNKKFIVFETTENDFVASLKNIYYLLYDCYKRDITIIKDNEVDSDNDEIKTRVLKSFEHYFQKALSPIEVDVVEKRIDNGISESIIIDSLKDAYNLNSLSIKKIDQIILNKIKDDD